MELISYSWIIPSDAQGCSQVVIFFLVSTTTISGENSVEKFNVQKVLLGISKPLSVTVVFAGIQ